jgi:DNA modification methylase
MPRLEWDSKTDALPAPGAFQVDSRVYPQGVRYPDFQPENQLILGDNSVVMSTLLAEYAGKVDLIYADPPFFSQRRYPARIGRGEDSRRPQDWKLAEGYPDAWPTLDAYLDMLYPRLKLMHQLLSPTGALYLHLDWHASSYARLLLDEIFGAERLLNEIVWVYHGPSPIRSAFNRKHDTILVYTKGEQYTFNVDAVRQPYNSVTVKTFNSSPKAGFGKMPDLARGKVPEDWWYFPVVARMHNERSGYPTQKPEALLERIILASSNPGDLVADFFCGSGTSLAVAARLGRRFIGSDIAPRAIQTSRSRLVRAGVPPFTLLVEQANLPGWIPNTAGHERKLYLKLAGNAAYLDGPELSEVDYWEVDPHWDGQIFHSVAQAVRPLRKGNIPQEVILPVLRDMVIGRGVDTGGNPFILQSSKFEQGI